MEAPSLEGVASQDPDEFTTVYTHQGTTTTCTPVGDYRADDISTDKFLTGMRVAGYLPSQIHSAVGKGRNTFDVSFHSDKEALQFRERYGPKGTTLNIGKLKYTATPALPIPKSIRKPWTPIFVTGVAVCISDEKIKQKIQQYAEVKTIYRLKHKNFPTILNGTRKVMVANIKKEIPERAYIEGCRAWLTLKGNITCFTCGKKGHIAKDCEGKNVNIETEQGGDRALSKHSVWGGGKTSTPIPRNEKSHRDSNPQTREAPKTKVTLTDLTNEDFPPLEKREGSRSEGTTSPSDTMRFIDLRHSLMMENDTSPIINSSMCLSETETNTEKKIDETDGDWNSNIDSWHKASASPDPKGQGLKSSANMSEIDSVAADSPSEAELESPKSEGGQATQDVFRTYSQRDSNPENIIPDKLPQITENDLEEGEIQPESPPGSDAEPDTPATEVTGGAGKGAEIGGDEEAYYSLETDIEEKPKNPPPDTKSKKKKHKTKRKRPDEPSSGDRKSHELKRKAMYRTETEKMVDRNIREIIRGKEN